jgi:hypothetical protein
MLSTGPEINCFLHNPKIHYRVHKTLPLDHYLSQMNPIYVLTPYFLSLHLKIIFQSKYRSVICPLPSSFPNIFQNHFSLPEPYYPLHLMAITIFRVWSGSAWPIAFHQAYSISRNVSSIVIEMNETCAFYHVLALRPVNQTFPRRLVSTTVGYEANKINKITILT